MPVQVNETAANVFVCFFPYANVKYGAQKEKGRGLTIIESK